MTVEGCEADITYRPFTEIAESEFSLGGIRIGASLSTVQVDREGEILEERNDGTCQWNVAMACARCDLRVKWLYASNMPVGIDQAEKSNAWLVAESCPVLKARSER